MHRRIPSVCPHSPPMPLRQGFFLNLGLWFSQLGWKPARAIVSPVSTPLGVGVIALHREPGLFSGCWDPNSGSWLHSRYSELLSYLSGLASSLKKQNKTNKTSFCSLVWRLVMPSQQHLVGWDWKSIESPGSPATAWESQPPHKSTAITIPEQNLPPNNLGITHTHVWKLILGRLSPNKKYISMKPP